MASKIQYDVIANMAARGSFRGLRGMYTAMKPVFAGLGSIQKQVTELGAAIRGTTQQTAMGWGKMAGSVMAAAGPAGLGLAVKSGLAFNQLMENTQLNIATIYNLFNYSAKAAEVVDGKLTQWQYNLQASKAVMKELYTIAEKTPGEFQDVAAIYQNAVSGISSQTQDLGRHLEFMKRASLLGSLTGGRYDVLGAQMGRMLSGSAGAEMDTWKQLQDPILKAGQAMGVFKKNMVVGEDLTQAFNKLGGDTRLNILMESMKGISDEVAAAWGNSMDGVLGTTKSAINQLKQRVTAPLYEGLRKGLLGANANGGVLGKDNMERWNNFADQAGVKLATAGMWVFHQAERAAAFIRDNWLDIMITVRSTGIVLAGLIKGAFAWGLARWIAGTAIMGVGKVGKGVSMAKDFAAKVKPVFDRQARLTHAAIVRGAHDKRGGILGGLGKLLGARTNRMERDGRASYTFRDRFRRNSAGRFAGGKNGGGGLITRLGGGLGADPFRNIAKFLAKAGSLGMVFAAGAPALAAAVVLFGGLFVIIGGIAAYAISNWKAISGAIVKGLQDGSITLTPLLVAAYGFWARLKLIGQYLLGGSDHASQFNTVLGWMTSIIGFASSAVSVFLQGMAFFIGIWYTVKLAVYGFMKVVMGLVELMWSVNAIDFKTVSDARQNMAAYSAGMDETAASGAGLLNLADRLDSFQFGALEMANIQKEADDMAASLKAMLEGKGVPPGTKVPGAKVNIEKNYMQIDLRDEDPDRMMSMLFEPIARLAEHRVQSGALPAGGV